ICLHHQGPAATIPLIPAADPTALPDLARWGNLLFPGKRLLLLSPPITVEVLPITVLLPASLLWRPTPRRGGYLPRAPNPNGSASLKKLLQMSLPANAGKG